MDAIKISRDKIVLELSMDELGVLSNTLNEVCNGIEVWEFETRMGANIEEASNILEFLSSTYTTASKCNE